ncbi:MAG: hypothetical protein EZS26_000536 [Candidatus Ordinivivax streblomastigis]|uniref:Uncharacterized protein n=1 Tax=Candidatus Ordinivivax streblomastigis TaxID=2540710 RepID=A0A5M8P550_9BACT|nr:MAG: hypothetical protein EZS26_000431 [Candidatus Ordinivivax streblomastigis]KAA6303376.1 MAG: hypothetical protein EZS26_000536 [Candidatus Ordinivivax streblomastigis]
MIIFQLLIDKLHINIKNDNKKPCKSINKQGLM